MLVDAGANVNYSYDYVTPLWLAMKSGNVAIAQVLLQCGADTNQTYRNKTLWDWVVVDHDHDDESHSNDNERQTSPIQQLLNLPM